MPQLAKQYRPEAVEQDMLEKWKQTRAFHAVPDPERDPYCIVIPPPNVTAALHMGHALNNTLQDVLTRYHRMRGDNTLWMPGTDHAGIATQTVVDKRLQATEGEKSLKDYKLDEAAGKPGREQFIEKVQAWKDEYEQRITEQLRLMGCSCDYERQRFTMDAVCAAAVREAFFQLFKDGLIYRGKRLVNWDPVTQTALADDEVEMQEIDGHFWYMNYPVVDQTGRDTGEFVTVATTRPETMLGDTAVAVNPNDPERATCIGKHVRLPIVNRVIPIIGDDYVTMPDSESSDTRARYASGFLKVTPAHDPNDYEIGQRHSLAMINVMAPDATISEKHGWPEDDFANIEDFCRGLLGKDRYEARRMVVKCFKQRDLLPEVRDYRHSVGHSYRSHVPVEPYLSDQWYVKVTDDRLAGAALRAMDEKQRSEGECVWSEKHPHLAPGESPGAERPSGHASPANAPAPGDSPGAKWEGGLRFTPDRYARTFQHWHENIRDWCISRQLWWGHRIPVWSASVTIPFQTKSARTRDFISNLAKWEKEKRIALYQRNFDEWNAATDEEIERDELHGDFVCVRDPNDNKIIEELEAVGYRQDPDVLDTWFSSALWPISTLGWPNPDAFVDGTSDGSPAIPEGAAALEQWNPSSTLCTAREIITLWVSRMVMFNIYFRGCLPFEDVFIHAMIQDGHGQKMSKSLGNGVDPLDIIHSHGSDAMRFTLTSMTTQTQDVRMPVDMVCPHTGETFTPKFINDGGGHQVAAPIQECPGDKSKKMVSSYGVASGKATATDDMPAARNTSEKFDVGRNFANKLWNAVRFALEHLEAAKNAGADDAASPGPMSLPDRWILSRTVRTLEGVDAALSEFDFHGYANRLYQFVWNEVCDWYIEAVKPVIREPEGARSRQVLATVLDVTLRMLHPMMPFVTEKLWEGLTEVAPKRGVKGLDPVEHPLLAQAPWPTADRAVVDLDAEGVFEKVREVTTMIREVRTQNQVPPREVVDCSLKMNAEVAADLRSHIKFVESLTNTRVVDVGPDVAKPESAAVVVRPLGEAYLHLTLDVEKELARLTKRREDVEKSIKQLTGRLSNKGYVDKAPAHLVQETRDQLADAEREKAALDDQIAALE